MEDMPLLDQKDSFGGKSALQLIDDSAGVEQEASRSLIGAIGKE